MMIALKYVLTILGLRNKVLIRGKGEFGATDGENQVLSGYTAKESMSINAFRRDGAGSHIGFVAPKVAKVLEGSVVPLVA